MSPGESLSKDGEGSNSCSGPFCVGKDGGMGAGASMAGGATGGGGMMGGMMGGGGGGGGVGGK